MICKVCTGEICQENHQCAWHQVGGEKNGVIASAALMQSGLDVLRAHGANRDMQCDIAQALEACCCVSPSRRQQCPVLLLPEQAR